MFHSSTSPTSPSAITDPNLFPKGMHGEDKMSESNQKGRAQTSSHSLKGQLVNSNGESPNYDYLKSKTFEIFTAEDYEKVEVSEWRMLQPNHLSDSVPI